MSTPIGEAFERLFGLTITVHPDSVTLRKPNGDTRTVHPWGLMELFDMCNDFTALSRSSETISELWRHGHLNG